MTSVLLAVLLLDAESQPLVGEVHVDGQWCLAVQCPLNPGRHVLDYQGVRHVFHLATGQPEVRVLSSQSPSSYGVSMRRFGPVPEPVSLPVSVPGQTQILGYTLSGDLPSVVRVARHADNHCGNPILRIDEVPLESYVAGVVHGEIGIFRAAGTGPGLAIARSEIDQRVLAAFETFAIAARSYVVWWYLRKGADADFHIHDGPCNQVYQDARDPVSERAVERTSGMILVPPNNTGEIDKHEYASSCARHGTLPSYRNAHDVRVEDIVPDDGLDQVCVRNWCGHDRYQMAHQDNPFVEAGNRCLVRGICQWGSLERAVRGDTYHDILRHYQPDLSVYRPSEAVVPGRIEGTVVDEQGQPLSGARVLARMDQRERIEFTDADGSYRLANIEPGMWQVSIRVQGYNQQRASLRVVAGETSFQHFSLRLSGGASDGGSDPLADAANITTDTSRTAPADNGWLTDAGQSDDHGRRSPPESAAAEGCGCSGGAYSSSYLLLLLLRGRRRRVKTRAMGR